MRRCAPRIVRARTWRARLQRADAAVRSAEAGRHRRAHGKQQHLARGQLPNGAGPPRHHLLVELLGALAAAPFEQPPASVTHVGRRRGALGAQLGPGADPPARVRVCQRAAAQAPAHSRCSGQEAPAFLRGGGHAGALCCSRSPVSRFAPCVRTAVCGCRSAPQDGCGQSRPQVCCLGFFPPLLLPPPHLRTWHAPSIRGRRCPPTPPPHNLGWSTCVRLRSLLLLTAGCGRKLTRSSTASA